MLIFHPHVSLQGFSTSLMKDLPRQAMISFIALFLGQNTLEAKSNNCQEERKRPGLIRMMLRTNFLRLRDNRFSGSTDNTVLQYLHLHHTLNKVFP